MYDKCCGLSLRRKTREKLEREDQKGGKTDSREGRQDHEGPGTINKRRKVGEQGRCVRGGVSELKGAKVCIFDSDQKKEERSMKITVS